MKQRLVMLLLLCSMTIVFCSCSSKTYEPKDEEGNGQSKEQEAVMDNSTDGGSSAISVDDYDWNDYVTLGEYKNIEVSVPEAIVSESDVEERCNAIAAESATYNVLEKGAVESGDWVDLTCTLSCDGKDLSDYTITDTVIQIGSGQYFEGLENALVGLSVGEDQEVSFNVDEDFYDETVAGKIITASVNINSIGEQVIPEITDEWVASFGECKTVDEWKATIREELLQECEEQQEAEAKALVQERVMSTATFNEMPGELVAQMKDEFRKEDEAMAESLSMDFDTFIKDYYDYETEEDYTKDLTDYVNQSIQTEFVLAAIQNTENVTVTEEDEETFIEECLEYYQFEDKEQMFDYYGEDVIKEACRNTKIWQHVFDSMKVITTSEDSAEAGTQN